MNAPSAKPATPPTVLGNFLQPGFPFAKVFSVLLMDGVMVFAKSGSGGANAAGTLRASLGGSTPAALVAGAIGALVDAQTAESRAQKTAFLGGQAAQDILAADKRNFLIAFDAVKRVEVKGPNFAGEVKVLIDADKMHTFRIDRQSRDSAARITATLSGFLPGKVVAA